MTTQAIRNLIVAVAITALSIFIFSEYLSLRKSNNEYARRLGYGPDWRKVLEQK